MMTKETRESRSLVTLRKKREEAVRLRGAGQGVMDIASTIGMSNLAVQKALNLFEEGGSAALEPGRRGRVKGDGRSLSPQQEIEIQSIIRRMSPVNAPVNSSSWSRDAVRQLVERQFGICLSSRTVGTYLNRWGLTRQVAKQEGEVQRADSGNVALDERTSMTSNAQNVSFAKRSTQLKSSRSLEKEKKALSAPNQYL